MSKSSTKNKTRLDQICQWLGKDWDGVLLFDECHKAKNLYVTGSAKPTKTGQAVFDIQARLPKARVVYCSATGVSEPANMAYMVRLGLWGEKSTFESFNAFISAVKKGGTGMMELVCSSCTHFSLRSPLASLSLAYSPSSPNFLHNPFLHQPSLVPHRWRCTSRSRGPT